MAAYSRNCPPSLFHFANMIEEVISEAFHIVAQLALASLVL